jgi:hypothetical protein
MDGYKYVSGFPLIGTLLIVLTGILFFGAQYTAIIGLAVLIIDTGGLLWFFVASCHPSFWDEHS